MQKNEEKNIKKHKIVTKKKLLLLFWKWVCECLWVCLCMMCMLGVLIS